jgi:hypothetical protein
MPYDLPVLGFTRGYRSLMVTAMTSPGMAPVTAMGPVRMCTPSPLPVAPRMPLAGVWPGVTELLPKPPLP